MTKGASSRRSPTPTTAARRTKASTSPTSPNPRAGRSLNGAGRLASGRGSKVATACRLAGFATAAEALTAGALATTARRMGARGRASRKAGPRGAAPFRGTGPTAGLARRATAAAVVEAQGTGA